MNPSNVYYTHPPEYEQLYMASLRGDLETVKTLISSGTVSVNARGNHGVTPLCFAVGHLDVVQYLLEQGAHPNALDVYKNTPFRQAVCLGNLDVIRCFMDYGADPWIPNCIGITCFEVRRYNRDLKRSVVNETVVEFMKAYYSIRRIKS